MQVTRESPSELEFESRPTGALRSFGFFVLVFAVIAAAFWEPLTLKCERGGECRLRRYGLLFSGEERFPEADLRGASVESHESEDSTVYRVVLETARGQVPVTSAYTTGTAGKTPMAQAVNDFVQVRNTPALTLTDFNPLLLLIAVALLGLGAWMVARGSVRHVGVIQRATRRLVLTRRGLFGRRTTQYPLSALAPLSTKSTGEDNDKPVLRVTLETMKGESVFSTQTFDTPETQDALARMNTFLKAA